METLHFSITINAPVQKVWDTMFNDSTYREWAAEFNEGSYYDGKWEAGSLIKFLGPDENGEVGGMLSRITEVRQNKFVDIEHYGMVMNGKEDTTSDMVKSYAGAHENYTFTDLGNNITKLDINVDVIDIFKDDMQVGWLKALDKLKGITEKNM